MASSSIPKPKKLRFKGDTKKHRKKRHSLEEDEEYENINSLPEEGWIRVQDIADINGPIFILYNNNPLLCLTIDELQRLTFKALGHGNIVHLSFEESTALSDEDKSRVILAESEPESVNQVFVATKLLDTEGYSIKSSTGKYLSCDRFGVVGMDKEAIGMTESWLPIPRPDGFAFQNVNNQKFLSLHFPDTQVAGGKPTIRVDVDTIGFNETFIVKCQVEHHKARLLKQLKQSRQNLYTNPDYGNLIISPSNRSSIPSVSRTTAEIEIREIQMFQSYGAGKIATAKSGDAMDDIKALKKAKKEGNLYEALLDRRVSLKADRYCK